jgi:hypothetical protein
MWNERGREEEEKDEEGRDHSKRINVVTHRANGLEHEKYEAAFEPQVERHRNDGREAADNGIPGVCCLPPEVR